MNLTHTLSPGPCATGLPPQRMLDDVPESEPVRKEGEYRRVLSQSVGRPFASRVIMLFTALVTSGVCTWMIMQHVHKGLSFLDDELDADKQAMKIDEDVAPLSVKAVHTILETRIPISSTAAAPLAACNTSDCGYTRWLVSMSVDASKDPCDNFYQFVCGGVTRRYPDWFIDKRGRRMPMSRSMTVNNTRMIYQALEEVEIPAVRQTAHQKAAAFYRECLASGSAPEDIRYVVSFIRSHQLWTAGEASFDPLDLVIKYVMKIYLPFLFALEVPIDQGRGRVAALMTRSEDFTNWLRELSQKPRNDIRRDTIEVVLARTHVATLDSTDTRLVRKITRYENRVANISQWDYPKGEKMMLIPLAHLGQWRNDETSSKKWVRLLQRYGGGALLVRTVVLIRRNDIEFFHNLFSNGNLLKRSELKVFIAWLFTRYLYQLVFVYKATPSETCASRTYTLFQHAVEYPMYSTVSKERIDQVVNMTDNILLEIGTSLKRSKWLDDWTKKEAVKKLRLMKSFFAYPSGLTSKASLDAFYANIPDIRGPFLRDYMNAAESYAAKNVRMMAATSRDEIDNATFYVPVISASVAYAKYLNAIYISAGTMLPPAFSVGGTPETNYGALGRVVAREMMRAYGPGSRQLDATGSRKDWWLPAANRQYAHRAKCRNQWPGKGPPPRQKFQQPNQYLEDIMLEDSLFRAYRTAAKAFPAGLGPVGNFSRDQMFYIAGCLLHCGEKALDKSPSHFHGRRCNVAFMNSKDFAEAFSCPVDSPMNPKKKCAFW